MINSAKFNICTPSGLGGVKAYICAYACTYTHADRIMPNLYIDLDNNLECYIDNFFEFTCENENNI